MTETRPPLTKLIPAPEHPSDSSIAETLPADVYVDENTKDVRQTEMMRREADLTAIVRHFQYDPRVEAGVDAYKIHPLAAGGNADISAYFKQFEQFDKLNPEVQRRLFTSIDQAIDRYRAVRSLHNLTETDERIIIDAVISQRVVFLSNLGLVTSQAHKRSIHGLLEYDDLLQHGMFGLHKAIPRFDYKRGWTFATYAYDWIDATIRKGIADDCRPIQLPIDQHKRWVRLQRESKALADETRQEPTVDELAIATGIKPKDVAMLLKMGASSLISLDRKYEDDEGNGSALTSRLSYDQTTDPIDNLIERIERQQEVVRFLRFLYESPQFSDREKFIFVLRLGLHGYLKADLEIYTPDGNERIDYMASMRELEDPENATCEDVGEILGLTGGRIGQIDRLVRAQISQTIATDGLAGLLKAKELKKGAARRTRRAEE